MVLSNGRVPNKCAAEFTDHVPFNAITERAKKHTNKATIGSSPQNTIGINVGNIKAKMVYSNL